MAIRNLLTRGIGFTPAGVNFLVTHGFSSGVAIVEERRDGGGGGRKKKPFKSWDQRQRERLEAIQRDQEEKFGKLPASLAEALKPAPSPYKRLNPATVKAYQNAIQAGREDDEEAIHLIMSLL